MTNPKAPAGLSARSRRLWGAVLADYELAPAEHELLRCACEALDRADAAADVLKREGVTTTDRYGSPKSHPAADIEARSRSLFARLVAQLQIKLDVPRSWAGHAKPGPSPKPARKLREVG